MARQRLRGAFATCAGGACASALALGIAVFGSGTPAAAQEKRPNVVMLMMDDVGWSDFGAYAGGGKALGHPTPNIDQLAKEGALFTSWYGQSSCTAGRSSFITGRIPIRSALSVVVAPGDENGLKAETPTIAEFFKKNGYTTYFSGKWHLGDKPEFYPIEHGFDEMKEFAAYYPGVYSYDDTSPNFHPWFPKYNEEYWKAYQEIVNLDEWEGVAGQPATKVARITYDYLADFDVRQADSAIAYIKEHADDPEPFFMDVNFMKMHNPTNPAEPFRGKSKLGNYSDSMLELDFNVGRVMDTIRAEAPDTIVIVSSDNGAWQDAWPDAGVTPFRGEKGSVFEGAFRVPGIMWAPGRIPAGQVLDQMMSHMDVWPTTAAMVGLTPPPTGAWVGDDGQPIYFDGIDNSAYVTGTVADLGTELVHLHRRRKPRRCARRHRRGPRQSRSEDRVEVCVDGQGHLARPGADPRRHRCALQSHHGPVREVRHDVQRCHVLSPRVVLAGQVFRPGQWLGPVADLSGADRVRQVDHRVSEHPPLPRRRLERPAAEPAGPVEPRARARSGQSAAHPGRRRLRPADRGVLPRPFRCSPGWPGPRPSSARAPRRSARDGSRSDRHQPKGATHEIDCRARRRHALRRACSGPGGSDLRRLLAHGQRQADGDDRRHRDADQRDGQRGAADRRRHPRKAGGGLQGQGRRPRHRRGQGLQVLRRITRDRRLPPVLSTAERDHMQGAFISSDVNWEIQ